tara:strand:+ start:76 stop:747 length:672 start_codon:yes stop_codon:yes gene_type:complete
MPKTPALVRWDKFCKTYINVHDEDSIQDIFDQWDFMDFARVQDPNEEAPKTLYGVLWMRKQVILLPRIIERFSKMFNLDQYVKNHSHYENEDKCWIRAFRVILEEVGDMRVPCAVEEISPLSVVNLEYELQDCPRADFEVDAPFDTPIDNLSDVVYHWNHLNISAIPAAFSSDILMKATIHVADPHVFVRITDPEQYIEKVADLMDGGVQLPNADAILGQIVQ